MDNITWIRLEGSYRLATVIRGQVYLVEGSDDVLTDPAKFFRDPEGSVSLASRRDLVGPVGTLEGELEPPVPTPSKIIGVGKNFGGHAREMKSAERPVFFMKAPSALIGHRGVIVVPDSVEKPDYEGEIVIVIGKKVKLASRSEAQNSIIGYMAGNDVTARDLQYDECMPWCLSKSIDTFSPTGPYMVLVNDYSELEGLCVETRLNGQLVQRGCAHEMSLPFAEIVQALSKYMTLYPGDLVFTGTPPGVGHPRGRYLRDGDVVEVRVGDKDPLVNVVHRST